MNRILAIGSMAFDTIQTPHGKRERALGGSANYFSLAASFFNPVNLVAVVGSDFPQPHLETLEAKDINLKGLQITEGDTFFWSGEYGDDLNEAKTLTTQLNVFEHFDPKIPEEYKESQYVFLGNIDPELQLHVLGQVNDPKVVALDSMNFWITGKYEQLMSTLSQVDILTINEGETYLLSNKKNLVDAAETILNMGPKVLLVKQGSYGSLMFTRDTVFSAPALPMRSVKDPTGAGDTFGGGFFGYMASMDAGIEDLDTIRKAIIYGSVMASFNVEEFSFDRLLDLKEEEIEDRYKEFVALTKFDH